MSRKAAKVAVKMAAEATPAGGSEGVSEESEGEKEVSSPPDQNALIASILAKLDAQAEKIQALRERDATRDEEIQALRERDVARDRQFKILEDRVRVQGDTQGKSVMSYPKPSMMEDKIKRPQLTSTNGEHSVSYPNGMIDLRKSVMHRISGMPDEDIADYFTFHLEGKLQQVAIQELNRIRSGKPRVPVTFNRFFMHLMEFKHGPKWAEDRKQLVLRTKQKGKPIAEFAHDLSVGLDDVREFVPVGIPTSDAELTDVFFHLLDDPIQERLKEYLDEFKCVKDVVFKAEIKGLGGHFKKPNQGSGSGEPRSKSADERPRRDGYSGQSMTDQAARCARNESAGYEMEFDEAASYFPDMYK